MIVKLDKNVKAIPGSPIIYAIIISTIMNIKYVIIKFVISPIKVSELIHDALSRSKIMLKSHGSIMILLAVSISIYAHILINSMNINSNVSRIGMPHIQKRMGDFVVFVII